MSGRMAMNTPWQLARVDQELFSDQEGPHLCRADILSRYADFAEQEQEKARTNNWVLPNNVLIRPIINLFSGEFESTKYRALIFEEAAKP